MNESLLLRNISQYFRNPRKTDFFVIEGKRAVQQAITLGMEMTVVVQSGFPEANSIPASDRVSTLTLTKDRFLKLCGTVTPQGIMAVLKQTSHDPEKIYSHSLIYVLENISDPGNLGTIFRTLHALGADSIVLSKGSVFVYNPKVVRSSLSAICSVPFFYSNDLSELIANLADRDFAICGTAPDGGIPLKSYSFPKKTAVLIGSESQGLSSKILSCCDILLTITQHSSMESLNAGVASSIIMYEYNRQKATC